MSVISVLFISFFYYLVTVGPGFKKGQWRGRSNPIKLLGSKWEDLRTEVRMRGGEEVLNESGKKREKTKKENKLHERQT